jgi:hypothetical protein
LNDIKDVHVELKAFSSAGSISCPFDIKIATAISGDIIHKLGAKALIR